MKMDSKLIQMTYASLFNEEAVELAKEHHENMGMK